MAVNKIPGFESVTNAQLEKTIIDRVLTSQEPMMFNTLLLKKVDDSYFTNELCKQIFIYIYEFFKQHWMIPTIASIESMFSGYVVYDIQDSVTLHTDELIYRWTEREAKQALVRIQGCIDKEQSPISLIAELQNIYTIQRNQNGEEFFVDSSIGFVENYEERLKNKDDFTGIKIGLPYMDDLMGWILPTDFIGVLADEKMGKSWIMLWIAYQAMKGGKNVLFFSPEMDNTEVLTRLHLIHTNLDSKSLLQGTLSEAELAQWRDKTKILQELHDQYGWEFVTVDDMELEDFNIANMKARLKEIDMKLKSKYIQEKPEYKEYYEQKTNVIDMIIIDWFHLMNGQDIVQWKNTSEWKELQRVSQKLRFWARIWKIPILMSLHTNRDKQKQTEKIIPDGSDTSLTSSLGRDLTALISLFSTPSLRDKHKLWMACKLNRRAPEKIWNIDFNPEMGLIKPNTQLKTEKEFIDEENQAGLS